MVSHILDARGSSYYNTATTIEAVKYSGLPPTDKRRYGLKTVTVKYFQSEAALKRYIEQEQLNLSWTPK